MTTAKTTPVTDTEPPDDAPAPAGDPSAPGLSRRQFLPRAAAGAVGLVVAGVAGYEIHGSDAASSSPAATSSTASTTAGSSGGGEEVQSFVTEPDLHPPAVRVSQLGPVGNSPQYVMLTANNVVPGGVVQQGLMIVNRQGQLIYFQPTAGKPFDLNVQTYQGHPALTWWNGELISSHGAGVGQIANAAYQAVHSVQAGDGLKIDLHELKLTARGTALITAYQEVAADLTSIGGSASHKVWSGHAQEIDLKTGKVLLDWDSLDHIPVAETYEPTPRAASSVLDYIHINSVSETADGNLLISGRNTSALYKIDRSSGRVLWRLGGKKTDFKLAQGSAFHYQHDARAWSPTTYTVFDNGAVNTEKRSRGLLLSVDEDKRTVSLTQQYLHPAGFVSSTLGSVTLLANGHVFVGWGSQPYFSEFAADGTMLFDGQLPINVRSYRAFLTDWVATPGGRPAIAAKANPAGGFVVRASWNGATEIDRWQVLAGPAAATLTPIASQAWSGFETAIVVDSSGPAFCVVALDRAGHELGRSAVV